ncbi:hypothetical protein EV652_102235 [Kribbella steppae]|uniref:Uncharacterized protein n=1 Tax=Kribbella steppae TaxID=2512223 RepID=A0A4V2S0W1_9ACTN|nr:hypothetical protein [Kribbella steppae]TCO34170.1 hypothetical protein EV652_102235 [Kribbella steppae]
MRSFPDLVEVVAVYGKKRWIGWVVITVGAFILSTATSLLADWIADSLTSNEPAPSYAWALAFTPLAAVGVNFLVAEFRRVRRNQQPPPVWTVADQAWSEALAARESLPRGTKEVST